MSCVVASDSEGTIGLLCVGICACVCLCLPSSSAESSAYSDASKDTGHVQLVSGGDCQCNRALLKTEIGDKPPPDLPCPPSP